MMLNRQRSISVVLVVLLLSEIGFAKNNVHDWNNVRILDIGSTIVVKTKQGEKYEGKLDHAAVDTLSIVVSVPHAMTRVITLGKDEVKEVRTKFSRVASTAIGAGIGVAVGIGLGAVVDAKAKFNDDPGLGKAAIGILGLFVGSAIGLGAGIGGKKVYESQ